MRVITDFHSHSRFSRACSPQLTIPNLDMWGRIKGVNLLSVADFTHPVWIKECEAMLIPDGDSGFYYYKDALDPKVFARMAAESDVSVPHSALPTRFMFTTELSFIYKRHDKVRRVHNVVLAPHLAAVKQLNNELNRREFNLKSDGRPILGMSCRDFLEMAKTIDERIEVIPAHVWTPWFAIFGSKSGYDSVEECYGDMSEYIFALETGLSSDPAMNYRVSALDKYILVSNSDFHSLPNLGREANVMEFDEHAITYDELIRILKEKDTNKFKYTIEFFPHEGRYHFDGHRDCNVVMEPRETIKHKGLCPVCNKPLTIGVDYRVEELADRDPGYIVPNRPSDIKLVELDKIIAQAMGGKGRKSKTVMHAYWHMIQSLGSELSILLDSDIAALQAAAPHPNIAEGIRRMRAGELQIQPGYDGVYGEIAIFSQEEIERSKPRQTSLF